MLEIVSKGFRNAKAALTGRTVLTEENITEAVREIRVSLLEADVEVGVVRAFLDRVKRRAVGEIVQVEVKQGKKRRTSTPGEHFILICHDELEKLMGPVEEAPLVYRRPYSIIMMVGLQGTGKTTTAGKLANYLLQNKRKPLLVAADVYRPAAVDQLKILGQRLGVPVYAEEGVAPPQLCHDALRQAKKRNRDVVIFDTAGRLAIDEELMQELDEIKAQTRPDNIFLVCDAMAGQDTVHTASAFNRRLDLTGFIMTKLDGDARGGAALTIKEITGKPIKFLGTGEGLEKLEPFRPEGLASRILGMGDVVGLMKDFEQVIDEKQAEKDTKKLLRGQFTLDDFLGQLRMLQKVGSVKEIYEKFPLFGDAGLPPEAQIDEKTFTVMSSVIQSMTPQERKNPQLVDESRSKRIAAGSGRQTSQVQDLLKRFGMMHTMMANFAAQPGLLGQLPGFKQLAQLRKLKGKPGIGDVGDALRAMAKGNPLPRMPGASGLFGGGDPGLAASLPEGGFPPGMIPAGIPPAQYAEMMRAHGLQGAAGGAGPGARPRRVDVKAKQKARDKRKAEKKARRKTRRK